MKTLSCSKYSLSDILHESKIRKISDAWFTSIIFGQHILKYVNYLNLKIYRQLKTNCWRKTVSEKREKTYYFSYSILFTLAINYAKQLDITNNNIQNLFNRFEKWIRGSSKNTRRAPKIPVLAMKEARYTKFLLFFNEISHNLNAIFIDNSIPLKNNLRICSQMGQKIFLKLEVVPKTSPTKILFQTIKQIIIGESHICTIRRVINSWEFAIQDDSLCHVRGLNGHIMVQQPHASR